MDGKNLSGVRPESRQVWILEDDPDIGYILQLFLSYEGLNVNLYPTAHELCSALETRRPELFLLDVMLPDGDGTDMCRFIKNDRCLKNIPVLMMSAAADLERIKHCGPDGFIPKPFDLEEMLKTVNQQLARHQSLT